MEINCLHFDSLGSTNLWSKENFTNFDTTKITLTVADKQTAGYGRYHRPWISPSGLNIYASFTFFVKREQIDLKNFTQITALSIIKTLKKFTISSQLKWPNDIQINKKKVAGILCEIVPQDSFLAVITGIGINVNMPLETCKQIQQPVTSLLIETGKELKVLDVLQTLQLHFSQDLSLFLHQGFAPFLQEFRENILHQKGDLLLVNQQKGIFQGIAEDGSLIMQLADGSLQKFFSGEIQI